MSFTMDSGIELMSENSTMDGSFLTDTWEYMKVKGQGQVQPGERQKKSARERTNMEDWKIRKRKDVGQERRSETGRMDGKKKGEGERISVEVELHNLKLEEIKKMERRKEERNASAETALRGKSPFVLKGNIWLGSELRKWPDEI